MSQGLEKSTVKDYKVFRTVTVAERIKKLLKMTFGFGTTVVLVTLSRMFTVE